MAKLHKYVTKLFLAIAMLGIGVFTLMSAGAAGTASLSLSPSSSTITKGKTWSVTVNVSLQQATGSVQIFVLYDASKLQFTGIDASGSAFDTSIPNTSSGGGTVELARYSSGGNVSGSGKKVATIKFKGLVDSGTSTLSFGSNSAIPTQDGSSNQWNEVTTGGTYTHKAAPTTSTDDNDDNNDDGNNNDNTDDEPKDQPDDKKTPTPVDSPVPVKNPDGSITKTFNVAIIVKDKANATVKGAEVTIGEKKAQTDDTGVASFPGMTAGAYTVTVKADGFEITREIEIEEESDPSEVQQFTFQDVSEPSSWNLKKILGIALIVAVIGVVVGLIVLQLRKGKGGKSTPSQSIGVPTVGNMSSPPAPPASPAQATGPTVITPTTPSNEETASRQSGE